MATQTVDQFLTRAARASGLPTQCLPKGLVYVSHLLASCSRVNNMQDGGIQQGPCGGMRKPPAASDFVGLGHPTMRDTIQEHCKWMYMTLSLS